MEVRAKRCCFTAGLQRLARKHKQIPAQFLIILTLFYQNLKQEIIRRLRYFRNISNNKSTNKKLFRDELIPAKQK